MPPPISDLLRSRVGQSSRSNHKSNNDRTDILPLHKNGTGSNNNHKSSPSTSTISNNNFLLGGMYVPNKDKRKRRRVIGSGNGSNYYKTNLLYSKCLQLYQHVYIRYILIAISLLIIFSIMTFISQIFSSSSSSTNETTRPIDKVINLLDKHRSYNNKKGNTIDWLLQDQTIKQRLSSLNEKSKQVEEFVMQRLKYEQNQSTIQQDRLKRMEAIVPKWYHRNDPIVLNIPKQKDKTKNIDPNELNEAIVKSIKNRQNINIESNEKKNSGESQQQHVHYKIQSNDIGNENKVQVIDSKRHIAKLEEDVDVIARNTILDNLINIRPSSNRIRRTIQNNIHTANNQSNYTVTSNCPNNLTSTDISVTLLIQSSIDRLWILHETCQRWKSPIIIVVAIHPTFHTSQSNVDILVHHVTRWKTECKQINVILYHLDPNTESTPESYPVNTLRNVALDAVQTSHIFMIDIDFVPSNQLDRMIQSTLIEQQQQQQSITSDHDTTTSSYDDTKIAMVIPAFDRIVHPPCTTNEKCASYLQQNSSFIPQTFNELQHCYEESNCIVFQSLDNWEGHSSTRTEMWLHNKWYNNNNEPSTMNKNDNTKQKQQNNLASATNKIRTIPCFDSLRYEPYVVLRWCPVSKTKAADKQQQQQQEQQHNPQIGADIVPNIAPYYDERFHGYGKNKIQLISHLRIMGYMFTILPSIGFIVHNPHIESLSKHEWNNLHESTLHTSMDILYQTFLKELVNLYLVDNDGNILTSNIVNACSNRS